MRDLTSFIIESNAIEGIWRPPTEEEVLALDGFIKLEGITVPDVERLAKVFQPNAKLRDVVGLDVQVGNHVPMKGGPRVFTFLVALLNSANRLALSAWDAHVQFELIHPLTDGNGRTGRAVWLWMREKAGERVHLPFLHHFYYETLERYQNEGRKAETSAAVFAAKPD